MPVCSEIALADMAAEGAALPVGQKGQKMEALSSPAGQSHPAAPKQYNQIAALLQREKRATQQEGWAPQQQQRIRRWWGREDGKKCKADPWPQSYLYSLKANQLPHANIHPTTKADGRGEQHHQWYDPNLSAGPTQGGRTDTETHTLWFYDLRGEQPTCATLV